MRQDPLIPLVGEVTMIRVDTPDVKTFRVQGLDGKKPFLWHHYFELHYFKQFVKRILKMQ